MATPRKGKSKDVSAKVETVKSVLILKNTYIEGIFYKEGDKVVVSKDLYDRIIKEKDSSLKPL